MKKNVRLLAMAALVLLAASCYKLISITAPRTVEAGSTFEVRIAVADDGSAIQQFTTDWSFAGIRVPEGWTVSVPEGCHEQHAESWVYYQNGEQVASRQDMGQDDFLTELYEEAAHKDGYKWVAFATYKPVAKHMTACWRNGCDSITMTFLVTVPPTAELGEYELDFLTGDEEDANGVYKYNNYNSTSGSRLFHAGTITSLSGGRKVDNPAPSLRCKVTVVEPSSVHNVSVDKKASGNIYDTTGRLVRNGTSTDGLPRGTYVVGKKKVKISTTNP